MNDTSGTPVPVLHLRRWQEEAVPLALAALEARKNGVIVATTGAGKSIALAEMLRRWRLTHPVDEGKIVVTTPSKKLVEQLAGTFASILGAHNVGRYYTKAKQWQRPIIVCCNPSVPTLSVMLKEHGQSVSLWIADECHKTATDNMRAAVVEGDGADEDEAAAVGAKVIADALGADRRLGFTATPFRSKESETLELFSEVIYWYPPAEALRDGVIVPWRVVGWDESREETNPDIVIATMIAELGDRATRGPGVVNATTIDDAESYCTFLAARGIVAKPIHSRQKEADQKAALAELEAGELDCLVHVSMLVEGVDFPWLRWGGLRRPVGARVRFVQEVGRYIRSNPGKSEAILLDPHDLFGTFQLTYEAALGWVEEEDETTKEAREIRETEGADPKERRSKRTTALSRYVRQLYIALLAEGIATEGKIQGGAASAWRADEPSPAQLGLMKRQIALTNRLDPVHAVALTRIAANPGCATKGIASDFLSLLDGLKRVKSGGNWSPASPVALPPAAAFEAVALPADLRWFVAGGLRLGVAAAAVVQGGTVHVRDSRPFRPGDTWASLTLYGVAKACKLGARAVVVADADAAAILNGTKEPTKSAAPYLPLVPVDCVVEVLKSPNPAARIVWSMLPRLAQ